MKIPFGCLMFILGAAVIAAWQYHAERVTPYLDQRQALAYALEDVQDQCQQTPHRHAVDCQHYKLTTLYEGKEGWTFELTSLDGRRVYGLWIGRRGEYDSLGTTDLDDPSDIAR